MVDDIKQLTQYLEEKFEKIDERFDGVDKKFDNFEKNVDDKFERLFDVFATKDDLQEITKEMMTQNDKHQLLMAVDSYAHKADTFFQELVMLSHQTSRHEKWIQMLAEKIGVKLEY